MQQQQSLLFSLLPYSSLLFYFLEGRMSSFFTTFLYSEFSFPYIQHTRKHAPK